MSDDSFIGRTLVCIPAEHSGHTWTVERRDIEKHKAYWLRCECGALTLIGSHWLEAYLRGGGEGLPMYRDVDDRVRAS